MIKRNGYDAFMRGWKADNKPVSDVSCPHCKRAHEVPAIPNTDSAAICPNCGELFMKVVDGLGKAHASVPGVPA